MKDCGNIQFLSRLPLKTYGVEPYEIAAMQSLLTYNEWQFSMVQAIRVLVSSLEFKKRCSI